MVFVTAKESFLTQMEVFMMENGLKVLWMVMESFTIQIINLLMKDNGKIMHFLEAVKYTMRSQLHHKYLRHQQQPITAATTPAEQQQQFRIGQSR